MLTLFLCRHTKYETAASRVAEHLILSPIGSTTMRRRSCPAKTKSKLVSMKDRTQRRGGVAPIASMP